MEPERLNEKRPHLPVGTSVDVIRHEHGWHDGDLSGVIVDHSGGHARIRTEEGEVTYRPAR